MDIKIKKEQFEDIIKTESMNTVGKCMKRFEISEDKNVIKSQVKELIYEAYRDLKKLLVECSKTNADIHLIFTNKEGKHV